MSNYIYEMDLARLRISYILPKDLFCVEIITSLENNSPYDGSNMILKYAAVIRNEYLIKEKACFLFKGSSLQEVTELVRRWVIKGLNNKQSPVNKSPEDGTDSVITG